MGLPDKADIRQGYLTMLTSARLLLQSLQLIECLYFYVLKIYNYAKLSIITVSSSAIIIHPLVGLNLGEYCMQLFLDIASQHNTYVIGSLPLKNCKFVNGNNIEKQFLYMLTAQLCIIYFTPV